VISEEELTMVMKSLGHSLQREEIKDMLLAADVDGNGEIDYHEFVKMMKIVAE
jgi:calmodulin